MGKIIAVIGIAGVGKTTLVHQLVQTGLLVEGLEEAQASRPFQALMAADLSRYALANQIDFLLARAEQERQLRQQPALAVLDGGLEVDFYLFTKLFAQRGYLSPAEWALCERLYKMLRSHLPPPDLFLWLDAPVEVALARYASRGRPLEIAQQGDLADLAGLLAGWLTHHPPARPVWRIAASGDGYLQPTAVATLAQQLVAAVG